MRAAFARFRELGLTPTFYAACAGWLMVLLVALSGYACSPLWVEARLQEQVEAALSAGGHSFATVEMDGQIAILSGFATNEADIRAAREAALRAAGPGGPWVGGVTAVRAHEFRVLTPPLSPYVWRAERRRGAVKITGASPSVAARARLAAKAKDLFPDAAVSESAELASGAPPGPPWVRVAEFALEQLARLSAGDVRLVDARLIITGEIDAAGADALRAAVREGLPAPYVAEIDLTPPGQGDAEFERLGLIGGAEAGDCRRALRGASLAGEVLFEPNAAALDPSGFPFLDAVARVMRRCDRHNLEVAVHGAAGGAERDLNGALSQERAEAIAAYLIGRGVHRDRLAAQGFGAAGLPPDGREAARRVEFAVLD